MGTEEMLGKENELESKNFIENFIDEDLREGKVKEIKTRFPPEPNGYLHIGHAKSILLNYGIAKEYNGTFNLRFDDTNPVKEKMEFVESIRKDVEWLGADFENRMFFASDYFPIMYEKAVYLIQKGKAFVDDLTAEEIREYRGDFTTPGKESPYRNRSIEENLRLFEEMKVLSRTELLARYDIDLEEYIKTVQIEARVLGDIARNHIIPTAVRYQNILIENVQGLKDIFGEGYRELAFEQIDLIQHISEHIKGIHSKVSLMVETRKKVNNLPSVEEKALAYCQEVRPFFDPIRYHCDKLELMIDDELWTLTKYRELLFNN